MVAACLEDRAVESERHEPEMAITLAVLEERVNVYIKFVWALMAVGFAWLIGVSLVLYQMNGTMNRVEKAQVDAPARIVAGLPKKSSSYKRRDDGRTQRRVNDIANVETWKSKAYACRPERPVFRIPASSGTISQPPFCLAGD